jgi:glycosyltransferase involved in cell wall biosynthesis
MRILQTQEPSAPPFAPHAVNLQTTLTAIERWLGRFLPECAQLAISLFRRRNRYDGVITADYRTSLLYGALRNLFGSTSFHVIKELYLDETTLTSGFRRAIFRWALRHCDCFITNCSLEAPVYSSFLDLPPEIFHFIPWPSNLPVQADVSDGDYVFAAGRSFRDWTVLLEAARQLATSFVIVAERSAFAKTSIPHNVTLHCDVDRPRYLELLRRAHIVAVPLQATVRSIGQAVVLEAMAFGKPIVTARVPGITDYICEGEDGLYYEPGDNRSLVAKLQELLADSALCQRLGGNARAAVHARFNKTCYSQAILDLLSGLVVLPKRRQRQQGSHMAACVAGGLGKGAAG